MLLVMAMTSNLFCLPCGICVAHYAVTKKLVKKNYKTLEICKDTAALSQLFKKNNQY